jgi:hypothetical protein
VNPVSDSSENKKERLFLPPLTKLAVTNKKAHTTAERTLLTYSYQEKDGSDA